MRLIGVPVVLPSNVPERILTRSASRRWVVNLLVPGLRASRNGWIASSSSASPGGHPSTTAPSAGPWLSPQVVKRSTRPKVLTLMGRSVWRNCGGLSILAPTDSLRRLRRHLPRKRERTRRSATSILPRLRGRCRSPRKRGEGGGGQCAQNDFPTLFQSAIVAEWRSARSIWPPPKVTVFDAR